MKKIPKIYWHIQKKILPNAQPSQKVYEDCVRNMVNPDVVWLDLGCGHQLFRSWRERSGAEAEKEIVSRCRFVCGLDYDLDSLKKHRSFKMKLRADISKIPFVNSSFDLITSNMVIEHLKNPEEQFSEIYRVLKDNGCFLFHTPNLFSYGTFFSKLIPDFYKVGLIKALDGREEEDAFKTYYHVNSEKKIFEIAEKTGLSVHKIGFVTEPVARFAKFPAIAFFELFFIKILNINFLRKFRANIICILKRPELE